MPEGKEMVGPELEDAGRIEVGEADRRTQAQGGPEEEITRNAIISRCEANWPASHIDGARKTFR